MPTTPELAPPVAPVRRLAPWMPLVVVLAAWLAQGAVLRNGWVWDDSILIRDGHAVARGWDAVPDMLTGSWGAGDGVENGLFRPLVGASLAAQAAIHGTADPFPFHLMNLFLHGLAAVLLLAVANRLLPERPVISSTAALLFAVHPLHTGTVSWIVARGDLLAAVFGLLTVLAWTRRGGRDAAATVLAAVCYLLAILSKEAALPVPGVLFLIDAGVRGEGVRGALRRGWPGYLALTASLGLWVALRLSAGDVDAMSANARLSSLALVERLPIAAGALVRMAWKIAVPVGLTGDASNDPLLFSPHREIPLAYFVSLAAVAVGALALAVAAARRRAGLVGFCLAAFALLALPVIQLVPIGAVFEDRFAYVPSLALLPLAGLAVERLLATKGRVVAGAAAAGALAALAALVPAAWAVASVWHDEESFDRALLDEDPGHVRATDRLATHLLRDADRARKEAAALPSGGRAWAGLLARRDRDVTQAVDLLERAVALPGGRDRSAFAVGLGDAYAALATPKDAEAMAEYERWLGVKRVRVGSKQMRLRDVRSVEGVAWDDRREVARVHRMMAIVYSRIGRDDREGKASLLEKASRWNPRDYMTARLAAAALLEAGNPVGALPVLERASALAAADRSIPEEDRAWLAATLRDTRPKAERGWGAFRLAEEAMHRPDGAKDALLLYRQAIEEKPDLIEAYLQLAITERHATGHVRAALDALDDAKKALDKKGASADDPLRLRAEKLKAQYEKEQAEEADPVVELIDSASFAYERGDPALARKHLANAKKLLDDAKATAADPRRARIDELERRIEQNR